MDKYKDLSVEQINALAVEKRAALEALFALASPTFAQITEAEALAVEVQDIEAAAAKMTAGMAGIKAQFAKSSDDSAEEARDAEIDKANEESRTIAPAEEINEADVQGDATHTEDVQESPGQVVEPGETAEAGPEEKKGKGQKAASTVATMASRTSRPEAPAFQRSKVSITAAADVPQFATGSPLNDLEQVAQAVVNRARGFAPPHGDGKSESIQSFGTANFRIEFPDDLVVDRMDDAQEVLAHAAQETRLPGGSLVASGGWCAPSETDYGIALQATDEGLLSLPEVAVRRGGIRYAISPEFSAFYANPGFIQTEAQAIAGTVKPCVEVSCPSFTEVRLDVEGVCIKVPILTNAAYPEIVQNFVQGTMLAHQHWINANIIGRLVTAAGAARVFTGLGGTVSDSLEALELVLNQRRQRNRLRFNESMEVVLPFWVKGAMRSDLGRRNGRETPGAVTDQELLAYFAGINANVQFVYDWQVLNETAVAYPTTYQALVYPAGTFVKGTADVINLNTVYDAASLAVNTYTGLFTEQGFLVAKMREGADLLTLPICNAGRMGALNLTCGP